MLRYAIQLSEPARDDKSPYIRVFLPAQSGRAVEDINEAKLWKDWYDAQRFLNGWKTSAVGVNLIQRLKDARVVAVQPADGGWAVVPQGRNRAEVFLS